jgi:hypothetical protein
MRRAMQMPRTQIQPTPPDETVVERGAVLEAELVTAGQEHAVDPVAMPALETHLPPDGARVIPAVERQSAAAQRADG